MNRIDWWHVATLIAYGVSAVIVAAGLWFLMAYVMTAVPSGR